MSSEGHTMLLPIFTMPCLTNQHHSPPVLHSRDSDNSIHGQISSSTVIGLTIGLTILAVAVGALMYISCWRQHHLQKGHRRQHQSTRQNREHRRQVMGKESKETEETINRETEQVVEQDGNEANNNTSPLPTVPLPIHHHHHHQQHDDKHVHDNHHHRHHHHNSDHHNHHRCRHHRHHRFHSTKRFALGDPLTELDDTQPPLMTEGTTPAANPPIFNNDMDAPQLDQPAQVHRRAHQNLMDQIMDQGEDEDEDEGEQRQARARRHQGRHHHRHNHHHHHCHRRVTVQ